MAQYGDYGERIARLEEGQKLMQDSLSRHIEIATERMDKMNDTLGDLRSRMFGSIFAAVIIVSLVSIAGTVVTIYAAISK